MAAFGFKGRINVIGTYIHNRVSLFSSCALRTGLCPLKPSFPSMDPSLPPSLPPSPVGVDLGTTFSVVAVNEHGTVRVIKDKYGDSLVPSIVSFAPGGKVLVGKEARGRLALDPAHTIYDAKRFIGREYVQGGKEGGREGKEGWWVEKRVAPL